MTDVHYEHRHLNVACELNAADAGTRAAEWRLLRDEFATKVEPIASGARLWLRPESAPRAEDLARREAECCGFLDFDLAIEADQMRLDVTSLVEEAQPVIACLAGLDPNCELACC